MDTYGGAACHGGGAFSGCKNVIEAIIDAMFSVKEVIRRIEPDDGFTVEDY